MPTYVQLAYMRRLIFGVECPETMFPLVFNDANEYSGLSNPTAVGADASAVNPTAVGADASAVNPTAEEIRNMKLMKATTYLKSRWPELAQMECLNAWDFVRWVTTPTDLFEKLPGSTLYELARLKMAAMCMHPLIKDAEFDRRDRFEHYFDRFTENKDEIYKHIIQVVRHILRLVVMQMEMGLWKTVLHLYDMGLLALRIASRALVLHVRVVRRHAVALKNLMSLDFVTASFNELDDDTDLKSICDVYGQFRDEIGLTWRREVFLLLKSVVFVLTGGGRQLSEESHLENLAERRWIPDHEEGELQLWLRDVRLPDACRISTRSYRREGLLNDEQLKPLIQNNIDSVTRKIKGVNQAWNHREVDDGSRFGALEELLHCSRTSLYRLDPYFSLRRTPASEPGYLYRHLRSLHEDGAQLYFPLFAVRAIWRSPEYEGVIRRVESDNKEARPRKRA